MKRLAASILALIIMMAMPMYASAALPSKIDSVHVQFAQKLSSFTLDGAPLSKDALSDLEAGPASELRIYMSGENGESLFYDQNGTPMHTADITLSRLRAAQLTVAVVAENQMSIVQSADFAYGNDSVGGTAPYVSIQFAREVVEETPFSFALELRMLNRPLEHTAIAISGTVKPNYRSVYPGEGPIDVRDGAVVLCEEDIPQAEFLIGDGISIQTPLRRGEKFYGSALLQSDPSLLQGHAVDSGDALSSIKVCTLQTADLDRSKYLVRIQSDTTLYVYDADMQYLGTTREALRYSDRYYLSTEML